MGRYTKRERIVQLIADAVAVTFISTCFFVVFFLVDPYARGFYCNDESIRFPLKDDTVPLWLAGAYGAGTALLVVILAELYINRQCCQAAEEEYKLRQTRWVLNTLNGCLLYSLGAMCTLLITEIGKRSIGRLRPHFIDVCKPNWDNITCFTQIDGVSVANYIYMSDDICTGDPHLIREARVSFPSGHSSFTVFSMVFVIIYIEARFNPVSRLRFVKSIVQLTAFILAWHTCMSRVSDFKHHHTDVIAGATIGLSVALFVTFVTGRQIWNFNRIRDERKKLERAQGLSVEYDSLDI